MYFCQKRKLVGRLNSVPCNKHRSFSFVMYMITRLCENFIEYISANSILTEPKLLAFVEN